MGLDHPLIQEEPGRWRSVAPEDIGIAVSGMWTRRFYSLDGRIVPVTVSAVSSFNPLPSAGRHSVPAVERQAEQYLEHHCASPMFEPEQRQELFAQVVEPTLQRELRSTRGREW